jgi:hypothetical protein
LSSFLSDARAPLRKWAAMKRLARVVASAASVGSLASFVFAVASASSACAPARTPVNAADGDGGEITCEERDRAQTLCITAIRQRCDSQERECEVACTAGGIPSPTEAAGVTESQIVSQVDADRCREGCGHTHNGCVHSIAAQCPGPCAAN